MARTGREVLFRFGFLAACPQCQGWESLKVSECQQKCRVLKRLVVVKAADDRQAERGARQIVETQGWNCRIVGGPPILIMQPQFVEERSFKEAKAQGLATVVHQDG